MGANQSRPSDAAVNEKLIERLQALHMKEDGPMNEKDGFVVVGGETRMSSSLLTVRVLKTDPP
jgi:bleomycin hydrolase